MPFYIHAEPNYRTSPGPNVIGIYHDKLYEQPMMWIRKISPHVMVELAKGPIQREATMVDFRAAMAWVQSMFFNPKRDELAYFDLIYLGANRLDWALEPHELKIPGPYMTADGTWVCPGCQHLCEEPVGPDLCLHPDSKVKPGYVHGGVKPFTCPYFPEPIPR